MDPLSYLRLIFDTTGFPARWKCGSGWAEYPLLGWLHIVSDLAIWGAYFAIPGILIYFISRRRDIPFSWIFLLFGSFILACGTTHLMEAIIFYWPAYGLAGVIKLLTALVSWATVVALVRVAPRALSMRSPEDLEREIAARRMAEEELLVANNELERRFEALRASEERFRALVEGTQDHALYMLDADGRVASWNLGAQRLQQFTAEEITGHHYSRFFTPEDTERDVPSQHLSRALAEGRFEVSGWRVRRDGSRFWANAVVTPLRDGQQQLRGFLKLTRDDTLRRQAEENARKLFEEETARKAAEDLAREMFHQSERLRVTLNSIGDGVITIGSDGCVEMLNPVATALTGWSLADAAGVPLPEVFHIVHESTRRPQPNPALAALEHGEVVGLANHTILIARDGTERPIDDSAAPIRNSQGEVLGVVLVFRDVTERKRVEDELRITRDLAEQRLAELEAVIDGMPDAVYFGTLQGISRTNERGLALLGIDSLEILQSEVTQLARRFDVRDPQSGEPIPPDRLPFIRALSGETVIESIMLRRYDSQEDVIIRVASAPIRLNGQTIGAVNINSDITQQQRSERSNRLLAQVSSTLVGAVEPHELLSEVARLTVPAIGDFCLIHVVGAEEGLECVSFQQTQPASPEFSHAATRFLPEHSQQRHPILRAMTTGESQLLIQPDDDSLRAFAVDDEHFEFLRSLQLTSCLVVPMQLGGRKLGTLTYGNASSRRKHTYDQVVLVEEIARRLAYSVENAKFQLQLQDADRRKDEFLATLAHELRNPLAPIRNALQILKLAGNDPAAFQTVHQMMERQLAHLVHLVDDLLDISRISRGKIELRLQPLDLRAVLNSALETSRPLIEDALVKLTLHVAEEPIPIVGDHTRLSQVISNLLNNSAKFTPAGGEATLWLERDGRDAVIRVRDTGIGIPRSMLRRVFEMFTQVDRSLSRTQGGLGIGLSLVQRITEMHHGSVVALSEGEGTGSEFIVRLPLAIPAETTPAETTPVDSTPGTNGSAPAIAPAPDVAPVRVLVVDDNVDSANSLSRLVQLMGHQVETVYDGPAALARCVEFQPDVVLLDIGLPGLNGYDVATLIRQRPELSEITLIAQTGWGQEEDRRRAEAAGFDEHMVKPVDPERLRQLLRKQRRPE